MAPYTVENVFGKKYRQKELKIDDKLLQNIAHHTGGKYFRAPDKNNLKKIYDEIDKMEKTKIEVKEYTKRKEEYLLFAAIAGLLLLLEILLKNTVLKNLP
jgi:Ca-activated chloride channel family protein